MLIAVIGKTAAGKSTIIGNLIGNYNLGSCTSTIPNIINYTDPNNSEIDFSEISEGVAIDNIYDCFIIVTSSKLLRSDFRMINIVKSFNKQYFVIRTHLDSDISNVKRRGFNETFARDQAASLCEEYVGKENLSVVFQTGYENNETNILGYDFNLFRNALHSFVTNKTETN